MVRVNCKQFPAEGRGPEQSDMIVWTLLWRRTNHPDSFSHGRAPAQAGAHLLYDRLELIGGKKLLPVPNPHANKSFPTHLRLR